MQPNQDANLYDPSGVEQRRRVAPDVEPLPPPYVTYALIAIIALVFVAMVWAGHSGVWMTSPEMRSRFGDKDNALIMAGQWWRFVTPIFLHGGLLHFAINSYSLYRLGSQMEQFYGARRYLILFIMAGVAGNVASFLHSPVHSVGASGALFGLIGAGIVFPLRYRALIPPQERARILSQLVQIAAINLIIGFSLSDIIDNAAHIGGMIGGGIAALFLLPDALMSRPLRPAVNVALWIGAVLAVGLIAAAGICQGVWAKRIPPTLTIPMQAAYPPDTTVPWWSVRVPAGWRFVGSASPSAGAWHSPNDVMTVEIADSLHDPLVAPLTKKLMEQSGQAAEGIPIDGKPARRFTLRSPQRIADLYLIDAFGRIMAIKMEADTGHYTQAQPYFLGILTSFRFIHPPTPEEDTGVTAPVAL